MRVRAYTVLSEAVERGVAFGWSHAHKHESNPSEDIVCENMEREVLNAICEAFDFDDDES